MSSPIESRAPLEILCVFSEVIPYAKTGGLGDVGGSLPTALEAVGLKVSTALPLYRSAREKIKDAIVLDEHLAVEVPQRTYVFRVVSAKGPTGQRLLFFDCPELFDRDGIYQQGGRDFSDNGLRFALFNKAVLEAVLKVPEVKVDIFHVHDWQASFVPIFRATVYKDEPTIAGKPCVLTIHNLGYQGLCDAWILPQLGLPEELYHADRLEYHGRINPLKGGILYSDVITTVSRRYAREIEHARWGAGLEGVLARRRRQLLGIVNGIDVASWDATVDRELPATYGAADLAGKAECKRHLQEELGLPVDDAKMLLGFVGRLAEQKGIDLLIEAMESLARRDLQFVFLGTGDKEYERRLTDFAKRHSQRIAGITQYTERWAHRFTAGCDALLVPSRFEPCGLVQLHALRYGAVPIVHTTGGLADTVIDASPENLERERATGFQFEEYTANAMLRAVDRALESYADRDGWNELLQRGMRQDFSWPTSAKRYAMMFRMVHRERAGKPPRDPAEDQGLRVATTKGPFMEWGPPLPARYQEDTAVLQVQHHSSLFLYWEVASATRDRLQSQLESGLVLRVRLRDLDGGAQLEERLDVDFGDRWFRVTPTHAYLAEIELFREHDGHVVWRRSSNRVRMPADRVSPRVHRRWIPVAIPEGQGAPLGLLDYHGTVAGLDFRIEVAGPAREMVEWQGPVQKVPRHRRDPERSVAARREPERARAAAREAARRAAEPMQPAFARGAYESGGETSAAPPTSHVPERVILSPTHPSSQAFHLRGEDAFAAAEEPLPVIYGKLCIVLHAHLPWVRHPEHVEFLEEDWLFEAISETYVPLLVAFDRLREEGVRFRVTMTMTPPLVEMLRDPMLIARYRARLKKLRELAALEVERRTSVPRLARSAQMHLELYEQAAAVLDQRCHGDLVRGFREHLETGDLEIVTCPATHGYLPLMSGDEVRRAQLRAAVKNYAKHFGRAPRGIWLSECAYAPGVDALLEEQGLEYFFVDSHSVLLGDPRPAFGIYAPVRTPAGPAAFARDIESGRQVWSADSGYPGDPDYREFYRDIGFDAPIEELRGFLHPDQARRALGFKYHRVTGKVPLFQKDLYDPDVARARARQHAEHFLHNRHHQCKHLLGLLGRVPVVTAMYDAELFGHWWFEGPWFLEHVFRRAHEGLDGIVTRTAAEVLDEDRDLQALHVNPSSWGAEGSSQVWLNGQNAWIYRHVHHAEREMLELARAHPEASGLLRRALNQAARELLLAQSSDWAFILTTGSVVPYAIRRIREHLHRFRNLRDQIQSGRFLEARLSDWEGRDNVFPELDYRIYV